MSKIEEHDSNESNSEAHQLIKELSQNSEQLKEKLEEVQFDDYVLNQNLKQNPA